MVKLVGKGMDDSRFTQICKSTPHIHQDHEEFRKFFKIVQAINPKRILEIGVCHGGTLLFWQEIGDQIIGIDYESITHGGDKARIFDSNGLTGGIPKEWFNSKVELVIKDSHAPATLEYIKEIMPEIDLLFIDGDHSYQGCKQDWDMYGPLVRPGGIVAFHDTNYGRHRDPHSKIKSGKVFDEIVGCRKQDIKDVHGIGIVWVGQEPT